MKHCRYCQASLENYHHNATHCRSCQAQYDIERRERARQTSAEWKKKSKPKAKGRKCRYCGNVLPAGRWFFCHEICQNSYLGVDRSDGEWIFE